MTAPDVTDTETPPPAAPQPATDEDDCICVLDQDGNMDDDGTEPTTKERK